MTGRALPLTLTAALTAAVPPERVPKLVAEWAIAKTECGAERIRQQVMAHPDGYFQNYRAISGGALR